ncbi:hypothetical protein Q3G72_032207 [Acer saccharum]|nr:hypothetical protein Q3G72_032207 [Acer saccharum]
MTRYFYKDLRWSGRAWSFLVICMDRMSNLFWSFMDSRDMSGYFNNRNPTQPAHFFFEKPSLSNYRQRSPKHIATNQTPTADFRRLALPIAKIYPCSLNHSLMKKISM